MKQDYGPFTDRMIRLYEGGYGWNRKDSGGPTKYGITCYDLAEHRGKRMTSMKAWAPIVRSMTLDEAEEIYRSKYANFLCFDRLPPGTDCVMMDYGVNSGRVRPVRVARALFGMKSSSVFTTELLEKIQNCNHVWFINSMCKERLAFMHRIRGGSAWEEFGHGWQRRVDDLRQYSLALHDRVPHQETITKPLSTPKANHSDPKLIHKVVATSVVGSSGTGAGTDAAHLEPWMIAAGIGAVVLAGVAYYFYKRNANAKADAQVILPPDVSPKGAL